MDILFFLLSVLFRPTFTSCGITASQDGKIVSVQYREAASSSWDKISDFRGSLMGLKEDTEYSAIVQFADGSEEQGAFRTWKSDVPVSETIEIDPSVFTGEYVINRKGREDGWIRFIAKGGVLHNPSSKPTFIIRGASYVLLDDMALTGAADSRYAIVIEDSDNVRIRNCNISGWGTSRYYANLSKKGDDTKPGQASNGQYARETDGTFINREAAVRISRGASCVVVERCFIHDPLPRACAWFYCHPAGPNAVLMDKPAHSTVLRWNDFIGSDLHRWNDAVEGVDNFKEDGGFNRDADVYGNMMIFANDDCIELDGGQQNIRCFGNRFESSYCGVSVQGCMVGPSFVYDNLFSGMGDEFGMAGQTLKSSDFKNGPMACSYVYNNIFWGAGSGLSGRKGLYSYIYDNTLYGNQKVGVSKKAAPFTFAERNAREADIPETELSNDYPRRPLAFSLSRSRVSVGLNRKPVVIDIVGELPDGSVISKPEAMDWLVPVLKKDRVIVKFRNSRMRDRRYYRGAFLVRTPDGLSRPVSVYATTGFVPPLKPKDNVNVAVYANEINLQPGGEVSVRVNVPETGRYWILVRGKSDGSNQILNVSLDGRDLGKSIQQQSDYPTWTMLNPGCRPIKVMTTHFDLEKGEHIVKLRHLKGKFQFDALVLTDSPKSFEPR